MVHTLRMTHATVWTIKRRSGVARSRRAPSHTMSGYVVAKKRMWCGCCLYLRSDGKRTVTVCPQHCLPAPYDHASAVNLRTEEAVYRARARVPAGWEDSILFQQ